MRELTMNEIRQVTGATSSCTGRNEIGGISDFPSLGQDLINFYEGLVAATSHVIERVANAF